MSITYGALLLGIQKAMIKQAFIPAPQGQQLGQAPSQQGQQPQPGQDPSQQPPQAPPMPPPQDAGAGGQPPQPGQEGQPQQDPNAPAGGDLTPHGQAQGLKNTMVTLSVADLLDLHSGGKATQSHLKTESMKVKHQFEHQKMLREEQRKQEEEQQKKEQEAQMQAQQQQGMMRGGVYGSGPMDAQQ